jgi:NO-binding membrane sensor protein with MHYT domain
MKNTQARLREAGSFIAGLLIGLSIVVGVFAMTVADPIDWQKMSWVFGALIVLALGLALQVVATTKPRYRRTTDPKLGALPIRFVELSHER